MASPDDTRTGDPLPDGTRTDDPVGSGPATVDGPVDGLVVLDTTECIALLESTPIGRMAFRDGGRLTVLPVTFGWYEDGIVFRTLEGAKLAAASDHDEVAFEVDDWDADHHRGWSVLVRGRARVVTDWAEIESLEQSGVVAWARQRWRDRWVRIDPDEITGRRLA